MNKRIVFAALLLASGLASAADTLVVTGAKGKGGTMIGLDYSSSGAATGFEFKISVPGGEAARVNLSGCLKGLPKTHGGACNFAKGMVIGIVYSDSNAFLPAGMLSLGTIGLSTKTKGAPAVVHFLAADPQGNRIGANVELGSDVVESKMTQ